MARKKTKGRRKIIVKMSAVLKSNSKVRKPLETLFPVWHYFSAIFATKGMTHSHFADV